MDPRPHCAALTVPKATFIIKDKLILETDGKVKGAFFDGSDKEASAPAEGRITAMACPFVRRHLNLNVDAIVGLRENDTVIAIILPKQFKITEAVEREVPNYAYGQIPGHEPSDEMREADLKDWDLSLSYFREFKFRLLLDGDNETEIDAKYQVP